MNEDVRFALLIDAENVSPKYIKLIMDELSNIGLTTYRRIYGDWTSVRNHGWKEVLLENSITPIQQYSYTEGKNASDSALIIDAMDILYTDSVDGFCIVSSDSDFTRLASRLRESGMHVVGMGEIKTPNAFISACHEFKYLDILYNSPDRDDNGDREDNAERPASPEAKTTRDAKKPRGEESGESSRSQKPAKPQPKVSMKTIRKAIRTIIQENADEDNRMSLASLGNRLIKRFPDFDTRNYGYKRLTDLVASYDDFELETTSSDGKVKQVSISLRER